jgi:hypothetical protein
MEYALDTGRVRLERRPAVVATASGNANGTAGKRDAVKLAGNCDQT